MSVSVLEVSRSDFLPAQALRCLPPGGGVVEVTTRTLGGMFLLKPSPRCVEIIEGVLARALERHPTVKLFGYWFLSNHFNLLALFPDAGTMASFMDYVNGNIARELGRLYDWKEKIWGRRYKPILVVDDQAQVARLRYLLAQGTKEKLVKRPAEWPGANCLRALLEGVTAIGVWFDRTKEYRARRRGEKPKPYEYATRHPVPISPLPSWEKLTAEERRARVQEMVSEIETEAAQDPRKPLGVNAILAQHPHDRPGSIARSPAPLCHASSREKRLEHKRWYWGFVDRFRAASEKYRAGILDALPEFPPGCFPPAMRFRPYPVVAQHAFG